jgi:Holliday junction DNA helicase RuvA
MIGRLRGVILEKRPPWLLLDVHGVGYEIEAPMTTFYRLPAVGAEVSLHTHLVVREDAHLLYGFMEARERTLFRTLIKVSGVGARLALAILSGMEADSFARCVQEGDVSSLTRLPGIGKKTAERLVVEMRDRLADWGGGGALPAAGRTGVAGAPLTPVDDAVSALVALGYKQAEALRAVKAIAAEGLTSEEIIRHALRGMV